MSTALVILCLSLAVWLAVRAWRSGRRPAPTETLPPKPPPPPAPPLLRGDGSYQRKVVYTRDVDYECFGGPLDRERHGYPAIVTTEPITGGHYEFVRMFRSSRYEWRQHGVTA